MPIKIYIETTKKQDKDGALPLVSLNEVIELVNQTDDNHVVHFQKGASQEYLSGWIRACEEIISKLKTTPKN